MIYELSRFYLLFYLSHSFVSVCHFYPKLSFSNNTYLAYISKLKKQQHTNTLNDMLSMCSLYTRGLWKRITRFLHFSCKPYATQNSYESVVDLTAPYHATLLMTPHGYIQHLAPFCTVKWSFLIIFMFKLLIIWYHSTKRVYRLSLIKSNW